MMKYHPDIELLLQYSSGKLAPALTVAVGLHQLQCDICQQRIHQLDVVGGATLESFPCKNDDQIKIVSMQQVVSEFDLLMADIESLPLVETSIDHDLAVAQTDLPLFEQLNSRNFDKFNWKRIAPKIWQAKIAMNDSRFEVELLKFSANAKIPQHTHLGREFTLVMQGDFHDVKDGYSVGEFIQQDQTNEHQPIAGNQGCICLAITDAPLKFTGTFGSVINWLNRK